MLVSLSMAAGVLDPFPDKPKGMHWRRYDRLRLSHDQAVQDSVGMLASFAKRMAPLHSSRAESDASALHGPFRPVLCRCAWASVGA
jgi:hypothetical protein